MRHKRVIIHLIGEKWDRLFCEINFGLFGELEKKLYHQLLGVQAILGLPGLPDGLFSNPKSKFG
jgi:hypothetical protein